VTDTVNLNEEVYDDEEASKLLMPAIRNRCSHWQIIINLAIATGMHRSELFGLESKHINQDIKMIHVRQALTYSIEKGY